MSIAKKPAGIKKERRREDRGPAWRSPFKMIRKRNRFGASPQDMHMLHQCPIKYAWHYERSKEKWNVGIGRNAGLKKFLNVRATDSVQVCLPIKNLGKNPEYLEPREAMTAFLENPKPISLILKVNSDSSTSKQGPLYFRLDGKNKKHYEIVSGILEEIIKDDERFEEWLRKEKERLNREKNRKS